MRSHVERKKSASAKTVRRAPKYIGFRRKRYRPAATKSLGGSIGAGVPFPCVTKATDTHTTIERPIRPRINEPISIGPTWAIEETPVAWGGRGGARENGPPGTMI